MNWVVYLRFPSKMLKMLPGFFLLLTVNCEKEGLLNRKEAGLVGFEHSQPP